MNAIPPSTEGENLAEASDYGLADCGDLVDMCRNLVWLGPSRLKIRQRPDAFLVVRNRPLAGTSFPAHLARLLFGDAKLVYDLRSRLIGERDIDAAILDPITGVEPPERGSLYQFVRQNGPCVIVFDDLQAFDPFATDLLADVCDQGKIGRFQSIRITAQGVVLACVRVQIPSVRELHMRWPERFRIPSLPARPGLPSQNDFEQALGDLLPRHLSLRNLARFGFKVSPWRRPSRRRRST